MKEPTPTQMDKIAASLLWCRLAEQGFDLPAQYEPTVIDVLTRHREASTARDLSDLQARNLAQHDRILALEARVEESLKASAETERLRRENDILRGIAAKVMPCHYCGAKDIWLCPYGFPGCSLADDLSVCDDTMAQSLQEARAQAVLLREALIDQCTNESIVTGGAARKALHGTYVLNNLTTIDKDELGSLEAARKHAGQLRRALLIADKRLNPEADDISEEECKIIIDVLANTKYLEASQ